MRIAAAENTVFIAEAGKNISVKTVAVVLMNMNSANTVDYVPTVVKAKVNVPIVCV